MKTTPIIMRFWNETTKGWRNERKRNVHWGKTGTTQGSFLRSWDSIRLTNKWNVGHPQYFSATSHLCVRTIPSPSPSSIRCLCLCPMCCPVPILYIYTLFCFKSLAPRPFINLYVWPKIGTRGNGDCDFAVCTILIIAVCNINDQWLDG